MKITTKTVSQLLEEQKDKSVFLLAWSVWWRALVLYFTFAFFAGILLAMLGEL